MNHFLSSKTTKPQSIKYKLVNSITLVFAIIIFGIYLAVDLSLDSWVDEQFDHSLVNKSNYLKSLVTSKEKEIELNFDDEFMPEFSSQDEPQYFQLWLGNDIVERSRSLTPYPTVNLVREDMPLNSDKLLDVRMPNGEPGRAIISHFKDNDDFHIPHSIYLTIYEPTAKVERFLVIIDTLLIVTFFLAILLMRVVAIRIVDRGLKPLAHLNQQIKALDVSRAIQAENHDPIGMPSTIYEEVEPIRQEINAYIASNRQLIESEKRITGDIAHELKTPIAEMISLSEVYINFPDDERIGKSYKQDVLDISLRMKKIVDSLLLLQRSASIKIATQAEVIDVEDLLLRNRQNLRFKFPDIAQRVQVNCQIDNLVTDYFCIDTILSNLLDNALYYSPTASTVEVIIQRVSDKGELIVRNRISKPLTDQDKAHLLEPLYQADSSRTNSGRHGIGLSIIHNLCIQQGYQLVINHNVPMFIEFKISNIDIE
jgi:signal transduction histidine kinase